MTRWLDLHLDGNSLYWYLSLIHQIHYCQIGRVRSSRTTWPSRSWVPGETKRSHSAYWIERSPRWTWKKGRKGNVRTPWWSRPSCKYLFVFFFLDTRSPPFCKILLFESVFFNIKWMKNNKKDKDRSIRHGKKSGFNRMVLIIMEQGFNPKLGKRPLLPL